MTAVNASGRRPAIGLAANTIGILNMSPINGAARRPGVGLLQTATEGLKSSATNIFRRESGVGVMAVTREILTSPFAFAADQAERPAELSRTYLFDAGVLFLATTVLGVLGGLVWPDQASVVAQSVLVGVALLALAAGYGVALAFGQLSDRYVDTDALASATKYGVGFSLVLISLFKLLTLAGAALVPSYSGSMAQALSVLGGMGLVLFSAFLLVEWPRRVLHLDEGGYYTAIGGIFLVAGLLLKTVGIA